VSGVIGTRLSAYVLRNHGHYRGVKTPMYAATTRRIPVAPITPIIATACAREPRPVRPTAETVLDRGDLL
jgi:hypothetical protein